jgi:hypothetical protein
MNVERYEELLQFAWEYGYMFDSILWANDDMTIEKYEDLLKFSCLMMYNFNSGI